MNNLLAMPFDNPSTYVNHSGVDYGQPEGTIIRASAEGKVTFTGWLNDRAGVSVIVTYKSLLLPVLYCHQPKTAQLPRFGMDVEYGTTIGNVGNTGRSTGPHLHMEIMGTVKGAHTYEGIWLYFDRNKVVGQGSGSNVVINQEEEMLVWLVGKAGVRDAGTYSIYKGKATLIAKRVINNVPRLTTEDEVQALLIAFGVK
jgi:murein DD-endopeptidase MepM/ murein hydrolase activator NlpD